MSQPVSLDVSVAMDTNIGLKRKQNQDAIGHMVPTDPDVLARLGQLFVLAAVIRGRDLTIGSVGDSPAYLMRDANPRKLTLDHTVGAMQREAGYPLPEDDPAGRKLVRALGSMPSVKVDIISGPVRAGDHVVLCSDGLTRYVSAQEIEQTVATSPPPRAVKKLIDLANERGGADNISVIVLRLTEEAGITQPAAPPFPVEVPVEEGRTVMHQPPPIPEPPATEPEFAPAADNPLLDLWHLLRGNTILTGIGMAVALVLFVMIMLIVANAGNNAPGPTPPPTMTPLPAGELTATAAAYLAATEQISAVQTNDAIQAAEVAQEATSAALTLTPQPPSGPQMEKDQWFRVSPGDPVPAFVEPDITSESATPLEAGSAYLIQEVNHEARNGPWYWVVDNLGVEARWVNGPSLHERALGISSSGELLPPDQQPVDLVPAYLSPTPTLTFTPLPITPAGPGEITPTPPVPYLAEAWQPGTMVYVKDNFLLRAAPSLQGEETSQVAFNETASVVEGPVAADGHWWWKIEFGDGRNGWVAQPLLSYIPAQ
jgi:hypothetical protein